VIKPRCTTLAALLFLIFGPALTAPALRQEALPAVFHAARLEAAAQDKQMQWIEISKDGQGFVFSASHRPFTPWGFNYDHDASDQHRLLEDYWDTEWSKVEQAFHDMKQLGANVVRIHLQIGKFMKDPASVNISSMNRLDKLVSLAETEGLYLDITGLGCYKKSDTPLWYDRLPERERWAVQARFWNAIATKVGKSPAVFCYNLMNEPVVPAKVEIADNVGEAGHVGEASWHPKAWVDNRCYVEDLTQDLQARSRLQIAQAWLKEMSTAIRSHDRKHLITVGTFVVFDQTRLLPIGATPAQLKGDVDFFSLHYYPTDAQPAGADGSEKSVQILKQLSVGKPIVIEETAPLNCSVASLERFITASKPYVAGWMFFYWGKPLKECQKSKMPQDVLQCGCLKLFRRLAGSHNWTDPQHAINKVEF